MLDDVFWATLGFIFLTGVVSAFLRLRERDACLRLLDDHHVTLVRADGGTVWGDLRVHAQGLELTYGGPHTTRGGLRKGGYLLYQAEMGGVLAVCRYTGQLKPDELLERQRQVARTFQPTLPYRALRWWRNTFDTVRDAFSRAMSTVIGQVVQASGNKALKAEQKSVTSTGQALVASVGNAYEPMLEAHIGHPVVLELVVPGQPEGRVEIGGYLAEYTKHFVAVFNVEHEQGEPLDLRVDAEGAQAFAGVEVKVDADHVEVHCARPMGLFIESLIPVAGRPRRLGVTLPRGASLRVSRPAGGFRLVGHTLRSFDLVCPRGSATIRYAGWRAGAAADEDVLVAEHRDEDVGFP